MNVFDGNDADYLEWLHQNPDGYVVNRRRCKSDSYLVLHRATCHKVQTYNQMARPGGFTERHYIKVCASDICSLQNYARAAGREDGSFSARCTVCAPLGRPPVVISKTRAGSFKPSLRDPALGVAMTLTPQITGNVGLYYCCYRLSLLGWNVMPTARNARGVDIVAYSEDATRFISIQVKALSKRGAVPLGSSLEKVMCDHWIIVNKASSHSPVAYVLHPEEVKQLATRNEKEGKVSYWLDPPRYDQTQFREAWARLGFGGFVDSQGTSDRCKRS